MTMVQYVRYASKKGIFMNFKKGLSALALLLALTVVGCNGNKESSKPAASSAAPAASSQAPAQSSAAAASSKASSSAAASSKADSSQAPAPVPGTNALKAWSSDETKAGMSNASAKEVKDETGDVQFTAYKLGTANDTVTFKWTPTADQAGKVVFKLFFTTKAGNATNATFWKQSATSSNAKMAVAVDGTDIAAPETDVNFEDICGGADGVVESDVADSGTLANPVEYQLAEYNVTAGAENTVVVTYHGGGYSFYIVGAFVYKA